MFGSRDARHSYSRMGSGRTVWFFNYGHIIALIIFMLILGPFCLLYFLSSSSGDIKHHNDRNLMNIEDSLGLLTGNSCESMKSRIQELITIKGSVTTELRDLEQKRLQLQESVMAAAQRIDSLKQEESRLITELQRLKMSVNQALLTQKELYEKNMPEIHAPKKISATHNDNIILPLPSLKQVLECRMFNCFDYSRCSVLSGFPTYFYDVDKYRMSPNDLEVFVKTTVKQAIGYNLHTTANPEEACIFIVLVGETAGNSYDKELLESSLLSLPFWNGDGRNHILLNLARSYYGKDVFENVNIGRAIVVQSHFSLSQFRAGFDLVTPPLLGLPGGDLWHNLPAMVPAKRKYLLSFQGELPALQTYLGNGEQPLEAHISEELEMVQELTKLAYTTTNDRFFVQFSCRGGGGYGDLHDWQICGMESQRVQTLQASTYSLVITSPSQRFKSTTTVQTRLYEALKHGAIPVILGGELEFPFSETVDWSRAAILLPKSRVSELHYLLRTISDADLLVMRRHGRLIWERYMGSTQALIDTLLAVIRHRLNIPPLAAPSEPSPSVFNDTFVPLKTDSIIPEPDTDESLGPIEPPFPSIAYKRNYSLNLVGNYEVWNELYDPFFLYPQLPLDPILPSEAQFSGSRLGFRPINNGAGGSGREFSESLGGNSQREQFTIVMLTYEREQVLVNSLARLYGLPYLNKVIVIWNSPKPPQESLKWPDLKVPVQVVRAERNSLNNRFLPFSEIETEAILSVDDDAHLRHDEIVFGFRVWREERDRVVGFPGRYHAWDLNFGGWLYNSNYSCQLSMVLTGAAFFHKYYSYVYSQVMPQAIRDKVDEFMNCEDIAMNFLVSHITRKPPVKVTSRWTFRCPGCPVSLSEDDSHFTERHNCINYFTQVYGYNPLLNTQYRVDSVLFKTRLPHDKEKCFKFI